MPQKSPIGNLASAATGQEFAAELAKYTTLSAADIETLFPKKEDQQELVSLLQTVNQAADENTQKAKVIERIGDFAGAVIKITKKFATGIG